MPILFKLHGPNLHGGFRRLGIPGFMYGKVPPATGSKLIISGISRDSAGAVLVSATVKLFRTDTDAFVESTVSDAVTGAFTFNVVGPGQYYYEVAYKTGSPDITGASVNTLQGVAT